MQMGSRQKQGPGWKKSASRNTFSRVSYSRATSLLCDGSLGLLQAVTARVSVSTDCTVSKCTSACSCYTVVCHVRCTVSKCTSACSSYTVVCHVRCTVARRALPAIPLTTTTTTTSIQQQHQTRSSTLSDDDGHYTDIQWNVTDSV